MESGIGILPDCSDYSRAFGDQFTNSENELSRYEITWRHIDGQTQRRTHRVAVRDPPTMTSLQDHFHFFGYKAPARHGNPECLIEVELL
ncbi:hypothetical protein OEZ60_20790 [Defluviimonas sp. WL0024]|uniref:Uncharacterized protein n=1 Tax=Albidovulum salinarum TaxID=2984153 RepID=A0ABT2X8Y9_9RHOB|nr:hypothetical protein [Defluviimonas sp. WL0024]MCU9850425.1 hypothetical protein [Defluviimonas sp. WL0024]